MTTEIIEGEAVDVESTALTIAPSQGMTATGAMALAALPDDEFDRRLDALEKGRDRVARIQRALMVPDVDYGVIPGTGTRPTLLKPGAEKLCQAYGLAADFIPRRIVGDGITEPNLSYLTRCDLHLGSTDGPIVAVGHGASNSWERKHRYRRGERVCPECGQPAIIKGKAEYGGGWVCFKKKGGCGSKWPDGDPAIEGQSVGDVENPDPFDLDVVLAKMSEKRAFVDATLRATAASGLFTQDVEELARPEPDRSSGVYDEPPNRPELVRRADGLIGTVTVGKAPVDMETRQTPDGPSWGFKLAQGRKGYQCLAIGPLADAIAMNPPAVDEKVIVWGRIEMIPWRKGDQDMPPFARILMERIQTTEYTLPAPDSGPPAQVETEPEDAHPEAPTEPLPFDLSDGALA